MDSPEAWANLSVQGKLVWWIAARSVWLTELMLSVMKNGTKADPAKIRKQGMQGMQPVEAAVFEKPGRLEAFMATGAESMRQGTRGVAWDTHLYPRPWDFRLEEINFPVRLLHGEADLNIPVAVARKLAADIPKCQAAFYPSEGHISTAVNHLDEVIFALVSER